MLEWLLVDCGQIGSAHGVGRGRTIAVSELDNTTDYVSLSGAEGPCFGVDVVPECDLPSKLVRNPFGVRRAQPAPKAVPQTEALLGGLPALWGS